MTKLHKLFQDKPYLAWYVANIQTLSEKSMLEHILNYGTWDDFKIAENTFGIKKTSLLFNELKNNKRKNLKDKPINYFTKYFEKYA